MKIVTIIGARPQFIKAAVVSRFFLSEPSCLEEIIIHTGQHFDTNMSDIFFEEMEIPYPHYNLNVNGLGHGAMTGKMLEKIEEILLYEKPDWVLVYGDTNSTFAGALAAKKLNIKVAHVEAGLRSFNMKMPEEINRILTDRISDVLFCPTDKSVLNLENEGYSTISCQIIKNGDVMQDAALFYADKAKKPIQKLPQKFVLCTIHRAENTDNSRRMCELFESLEIIAKEIPVVLPLHPRTKNRLLEINYDFMNSSITFIDPVGYLEMVWLIKACDLIMTDSGGLQKEAYFFGKYCVTLREETEWSELVEGGFNKLVINNKYEILKAVNEMLAKDKMKLEGYLYGEGDAANKILNFFKQ